jgi:hypothetical protein
MRNVLQKDFRAAGEPWASRDGARHGRAFDADAADRTCELGDCEAVSSSRAAPQHREIVAAGTRSRTVHPVAGEPRRTPSVFIERLRPRSVLFESELRIGCGDGDQLARPLGAVSGDVGATARSVLTRRDPSVSYRDHLEPCAASRSAAPPVRQCDCADSARGLLRAAAGSRRNGETSRRPPSESGFAQGMVSATHQSSATWAAWLPTKGR